MIPFNIPPYTGKELDYMAQAVLVNHKLCGDGPFTKRCHKLLEEQTGAPKVLLTTSGSHALELAALLCDLKPGDEVILPSYTFVSTANAFVLVGAVPVFVDIRPDTMNIDETKIEAAITDRTKVICVVHYAGIGCEMDTIMDIARRHNLKVVEDAAQGVNAFYKGRALGTIGDFGCYSFHETKNYSMGEGGAVLINDPALIEKAEIIREKGTNRSRFLRGQVDKYTWVEYGSSYLPSELNAAHLLAQLEVADEVNDNRLATWNTYREQLRPLEEQGLLAFLQPPAECRHNAHMFAVKLKDLKERTAFTKFLKDRGIVVSFHYVPLHTSPAGQKLGRFHGEDVYTTRESERLTRLPMFYRMSSEDQETVIRSIYEFFGKNL
ncbi:MAG: dTDP-4-amino-4,6-dideoxygalactose transaminase [Oscillospiraceae bacterium]|nr:dTDP-4-amino-4,6-dideoxygalactose transaminase [Oscillospiraceae bacterium]